MNNIRDLIAKWPSVRDMALDVGAKPDAVGKWAHHNRIPARWHARVIEAAKARRIRGVTASWMVAVHNDPVTRREA